MSDDIEKELRANAASWREVKQDVAPSDARQAAAEADLCERAADTIAALRSEVERLKAQMEVYHGRPVEQVVERIKKAEAEVERLEAIEAAARVENKAAEYLLAELSTWVEKKRNVPMWWDSVNDLTHSTLDLAALLDPKETPHE